jgi:uncharacterized protein YlzI (FlbEa/FlbD family)
MRIDDTVELHARTGERIRVKRYSIEQIEECGGSAIVFLSGRAFAVRETYDELVKLLGEARQ